MILEGLALRRAIDDALEEIERIEDEVLTFFGEVGGPEARGLVAEQMRAEAGRVRVLYGTSAGTFDRATSDSVKK
jgi:hypothetical protein